MSEAEEQSEPTLRFSVGSGPWCRTLLGDVLDFRNGINAEKSRYGSGVKFVNVLDVISGKPIDYDSILGSVEVSDSEQERSGVQYGDVLFQRSSEIREEAGQSSIYVDKDKRAVFGGFVIRGRPKCEINPYYLNYLLRTSNARREITSWAGGSTRYNVGQDTLAKVAIHLSDDREEQQKIADFLEAVDKKITALRGKRELLQTYKRGLMQQLFSQAIRLCHGSGAELPKWEILPLGEVADWKSGGTPSKQHPEYWNGKIPWISAISMHSDRVKDSDLKITELGLDIGSRLALTGTVLLLVRGSMLFKRIPISIAETDVAFNQDVKALSTRPGLNSLYLLYWLRSNEKRLLAMVTKTGMGAGKLETSDLKSLAVDIPRIEEQQKIADLLSSFDSKAAAVTEQIRLHETFKKGLLQKLFV